MYTRISLNTTKYRYRLLMDGSIFDQQLNKVIALLSWSDKMKALDMTKREQQEFIINYLKS